ncbi:MAG: hypothetical protein KKD31_01500 [Bacteroidetes bacterium]|nr:hypothetical protein [Bacteroidota bacterium]
MKQKKNSKVVSNKLFVFFFIVFAILFLFRNRVYCQDSTIINKWYGQNGTVVFDFHPEQMTIFTILKPRISKKWIIQNNYLILDDGDSLLNPDTLIILSLCKDSLVLDLAKPRGILVRVFYPKIFPEFSLEIDTIQAFLLHQNFETTTNNKLFQKVTFYQNGELIIDGNKGKWELISFMNHKYLCVYDDNNKATYLRAARILKDSCVFQVYSTYSNTNYSITFIEK